MNSDVKEYLAILIIGGFALFGFFSSVYFVAMASFPSKLEQRKDRFNRACLHHHTPEDCGIKKMTQDYWLECISSTNTLENCGDVPTEE